MKYFKLKNSINIKEIGKSPQSEEGYMGDIQKEFIPYEGEIRVNFKLPIPILENKAKHTSYLDVVMIPSIFLIIDDSFLFFLEKNNIGSYQSWKLKVKQKGTTTEKYNLFIINDTKQSSYIDYKKSKFYRGKYFDHINKEQLEVIDFQDYLTKKEQIRNEKNGLYLLADKVIFDLTNVKEDMFRITNSPVSGYFVSQKLKNAIEEKGFTGMEFQEIGSIKNVEVLY